ncbi:MAG TPA: EpsG family protein [Acholeplasmataceae bacterium]|nr:EpsG family protein [Acholeplasmataceae bacterium]
MLIYNVFLIVNVLIGLVVLYSPFVKEKYRDNLYLFISFIMLTLLGGLRSINVGTDTKAYLDIFYLIKYTNNFKELFKLNYEIGFILLNKIIAIWGGNGQTFLFVTSAIISFGFIYFIKKNSINPLLSVFLLITLYYYYASFNGIRQYIAIVILLNSFTFFKNKNFLAFISFILLASLFHLTAIFFLPLYILGITYWEYKRVILLLIILFLIYINLESLVLLLIKILPQYKSYLGSSYLQGYTGKMYLVVNLTIFFFILVVYVAKRGYKDPFTNMLIIIDILICTLTIFATKVHFANRISWYLTQFHIILIPHFLNLIDENKIRKIALILIIIMGICYHSYSLSVNLHKVSPYVFYWDYRLNV